MRALSIAAVLVGHTVGTSGFPFQLEAMSHLGNIGVRCFFVISGYLITTLLMQEFESTGRVSLTTFYARRSLRIMPASLVFIFSMFLAQQLHWIELQSGDLFHAITYTMNYHDGRAWYLNHLWSLSVEEQFYLLWPGLLLLLGLRRGFYLACIVVALAPIVRYLMLSYFGSSDTALTREFQAVADSLAIGCLLAGYRQTLDCAPLYARLLHSPLFPILPCVGLALSVAFGTRSYYFWGESLANLSLALAIDWAIRRPETHIGRILNSAPFVVLGTLSYSLYLWQEPFLNPQTHAWATTFPTNVALVVVTATASYLFVERPFLRLRPTPR